MAPLPVLKAHLQEFLTGKIEAMMLYILIANKMATFPSLPLKDTIQGDAGYISHIRCS